jgi:hypothetical protein
MFCMFFCFVQNFFFRTTRELEYLFFLSRILTLGYMAKYLNQIIFFFLHQNRKLSSRISLQNRLFCLCRLPAVTWFHMSLTLLWIDLSVSFLRYHIRFSIRLHVTIQNTLEHRWRNRKTRTRGDNNFLQFLRGGKTISEAWLKIGCDIVKKIRSGQSIIRSETCETMSRLVIGTSRTVGSNFRHVFRGTIDFTRVTHSYTTINYTCF